MSDGTGDERSEGLNGSWPGGDDVEHDESDKITDDLFAAIEEVGLVSGSVEQSDSPAGCYLSVTPVDRDGSEGVVVRWQLRDMVVGGEPTPVRENESVDILNEALGPLLLALGFPTGPYAVNGGWIVTGPRSRVELS